MPIKINNAQSINNDGHGFSFANRTDVELNNPTASGNRGNGFQFEGDLDNITNLITQIESALNKVSGNESDEVRSNLHTLLVESTKSSPSKEFISKSLSTLKDYSAKVVGSSAGNLILELIKIANKHWHLIK